MRFSPRASKGFFHFLCTGVLSCGSVVPIYGTQLLRPHCPYLPESPLAVCGHVLMQTALDEALSEFSTHLARAYRSGAILAAPWGNGSGATDATGM